MHIHYIYFLLSEKRKLFLLFQAQTKRFISFYNIFCNFLCKQAEFEKKKKKKLRPKAPSFSRKKKQYFQRKSHKVYPFGKVGTQRGRDTEAFEVGIVSEIGTELIERAS